MKPLNQAAVAVAVATLATVAGASETHRVVSYLNQLDSSATAREAHASSPADAMTRFGLSTEVQAAFLSGNVEATAVLAGIENTAFPRVNFPNTDLTY